MLNYAETTSVSTNVSLLPVSSTSDERETGPLPSLTGFDNLVLLCIGNIPFAKVSPTLKNGYLAACKAYHEMEETEYGPYLLLTGYEYAHLARQCIPHNLSPVDKREWHRGFVVGWNACIFGLDAEEQADETE
jgi:hypothetical protein